MTASNYSDAAQAFQQQARQAARYESFECPACLKPMHPSNWEAHGKLEHAGQTIALPGDVIVIDPEFHALIPTLSEDEYQQLEANIVAKGCRYALVDWKVHNDLVDGHNRYHICARHNLPYRVEHRDFDSRSDVIVWMIRNQLARRNITPYARGELALRMKDAIAAKAKAKQVEG